MHRKNLLYLIHLGLFITISILTLTINLTVKSKTLWSVIIISFLAMLIIPHTFFKYILKTKESDENGSIVKVKHWITKINIRILVIYFSVIQLPITINILFYTGVPWFIVSAISWALILGIISLIFTISAVIIKNRNR